MTDEEQADAFFARIANGQHKEAIDDLYGRIPWNTAIQDQVSSLRGQFAVLPETVGAFHGYDLLVEEKLAHRFVYRRYVVSYDRQPMSFHFTFYRPGDQWFVCSFEYKDDIATLAEELATKRLQKGEQ